VSRVLKHLKVYNAGEAVSAEDDATVDEAIEDVHAELQEKGLAYWDLSEIPGAVVRGLVWMVGADASPSFADASEIGSYMSLRDPGEKLIRAAVSNLKTHDINPQLYY
jgi:hypothetical protein